MSVKDHDRGYAKIVAAQRKLKGKALTVGYHGDSEPYQKGQEEPITVPQVAAVHEFGSKNGRIPPRPTMRPTVDAKRNEYLRLAERLLRQAEMGEIDLDTALGRLGVKVQADIKKAIVDLQTPELAEGTIRKKKQRAGSTLAPGQAVQGDDVSFDTGNPLIDTGQMLNSVTWRVK